MFFSFPICGSYNKLRLCKNVECIKANFDRRNIAIINSLARMSCNVKNIWILSMFFTEILKQVNLQYAMSMFGPPMFPMPMYPVPAPMPMRVSPSGSSSSSEESSSTTTAETTTSSTTKKTKRKVHVAFPLPMPQPMAFPAVPPIICRGPSSRTKKTTPRPSQSLLPIIAPQSVVIVPYPQPRPVYVNPPRRRPKKKLVTICSSSSQQSTDSSSCEYNRPRRKLRKRKRQNIYRRSLRSSESDNELLKPMLSYVAENGDVKFETKISNDDVAELLRGKDKSKRRHETVQVLTNTDETNKPQVVVLSNEKEARRSGSDRHKKVFLKGGVSNHVLSDGKKELIFRPPDNKKISNLSVSFQIS
ncbi:myb-like protein U [Nymphalis io]|uniref:myb-like protein U n=1 Tax=Inachis io TaxID=171585 RepID=UPI00216A6587|nr:myb-like protein U [Nymphalis io]